MDQDQHILARIRAGKTWEYRVLVDRHKDRGMTLAVRLLGSREEAEEAVQDAFLRAYHGLNEFRGESRFSTWFYRIVYNLCMTRVSRRHGRMEMLDEDGQSLPAETAEDGEAMILGQIDTDRTMGWVTQEIDRLPRHYQIVLSLFYFQEQTYEEIASVLDLPIGTVKTHLFRARAQLRSRLLKQTMDEVDAA